VATATDARLAELRQWLAGHAREYALDLDSIRPASADASFRRYFRIDTAAGSLVAMDAPPSQEDCQPFVHAAGVLAAAGVRVPAVHAAELEQGFLLLEDFGQETMLDQLAPPSPADAEIDRLYRSATGTITAMQSASRPGVFPDYDRELLERELMLYPEWYVARHRGLVLSDAENSVLRAAFDLLLANIAGQARVYVHRDYHSRNLMRLPGTATDEAPGVIDFQDAVLGPVTYDLVSLLRDAYVSWPEERQLDWAIRWWQAGLRRGLPLPPDFGDLWRDFEWMGLQRQLKVLGIFARLQHRDGKDRYLADMPRVLAGALATARRYDVFHPLARLLERVEAHAPHAAPAA
jgi:aminoglycoside/choline kinase family phosphotransferase